MNFRFDINGLRAIAVLAVVIFHFNAFWLTGGFTGVDVFFVISGFLMTSIIFDGIENEKFNLFKFYTARANRIIPVLAIMCFVLIIFGWFYLMPSDYRELGKEVEQAALFTSNQLFSRGDGYFDTNEKTKWLLHTWSLSVEWQFYIFFPLLIVALKKYLSRIDPKRAVFTLFCFSFSYCIYATYKDSKTAYFLLSTRAWEMLLGGLAFLYPLRVSNLKLRLAGQLLGLIFIALSYVFISEDSHWPGYMALLPVLGAYLIIVSHYQNNKIIENIIFRYIGKWSYSIYVWHWPIMIFGLYFSIENWWLYGIPFSILFGFISYQLIEKRKLPLFSLWKEIYKVRPFYLFLIMLVAGFVIKKTEGLKFHYSDEMIAIHDDHQNKNSYECDTQFFHECKIGQQNNIKAIVVGDSHADALTSSVSNALDLNKEGLIALNASGCPYILNAHFNVEQCSHLNKQRHEYLMKSKDIPIILINRYLERIEGENNPERIKASDYPFIFFSQKNVTKDQLYREFEENLTKTVCEISHNSPVYIVKTIPEIGFNVTKAMGKQLMIHGELKTNTLALSQYLVRSTRINQLLEKVANDCNAKILDPTEVLCADGKQCITQYNGRSVYRDADHLSEYGNKLLTPMFKIII